MAETELKPVAWAFEKLCKANDGTNATDAKYYVWTKRVSLNEPDANNISVRNVTPLYASLPTADQRVEALKWNPYRADTPFGQYTVTDGPMQHGKFGCWRDGTVVGLDFGSVAEAKAAAQADYEQRIRSALA